MTSKSPSRRYETMSSGPCTSGIERESSSSSQPRRRNNNNISSTINNGAQYEMDENDVGGSPSYCKGMEAEDGSTSQHDHHHHNRRRRGGAENQTHLRASLDDFMMAQGPPSITIKAVHSSPDKTTSTVSWSASPDDVAHFPLRQHRRSDHLPSHNDIYHRQHDPHSCPPSADPRLDPHKGLTAMSTDNLLQVQIDAPSSSAELPSRLTCFYIPVSLMLQREIEMQEAARVHGIGRDRWCSSRLFRMWKAESSKLRKRQEYYYYHLEQHQQQTQQERPGMETSVRGVVPDNDSGLLHDGKNPDTMVGDHYLGPTFYKPDPTTITLRMSPEDSLQTSNSSSRFFQWKPWLTKCIRAYYNTGILRIPDECQGDDILLALEFFGILTASPEAFVFDSRRAYERIQRWSRYFTYRTELAEHLLEDYDAVLEEEERTYDGGDGSIVTGDLHVWVLFPEASDDSIFNNGATLQVGGLPARKLTVGTIGGLYGLFVGESEGQSGRIEGIETTVDSTTRQMPPRFRQDFCEYVRQSMPPRTSVGFEFEDVHIKTNSQDVEWQEIAAGVRPVIRVTYAEGDSPPSFLGFLKQQQPLSAVQIGDTQHEGGMDEKSKSTPSKSRQSPSSRNKAANSPLKAIHMVSVHSDGIEISDSYAPKASPNNSHILGWKNPVSESTNRSPHTKTATPLAGEGIYSASGLSDPFRLTETILFPESPHERENVIPSDSNGIKPRIGPCEIEKDPLSPSQTQWNQNSGQTDAVVVGNVLEVDNLKKPSFDGGDSIRGDHCMAPIKYVDTQYGDLRSVTSMLSEPAYCDLAVPDFRRKAVELVGERSVACRIVGESVLTQKLLYATSALKEKAPGIEVQKAKAAKTIVAPQINMEAPRGIITTPPRTKRNIQNTPPWNSNRSRDGGVEETKEEVEIKNMEAMRDSHPIQNNSKGKKTDEKKDSHPIQNNSKGKKTDEKKQEVEGEMQVKTDRDANGYWGQFLAYVCEAVVPAPSKEECPRSPVQYITLETNLADAPSQECSAKSGNPHRHGPCRSDPDSALVTDIASSWLSTFSASESPDRDGRGGLNPEELLDKARELGVNVSSHFDALMKIAYDISAEHGKLSSGSRRRHLLSIPEEVPMPDHTGSSIYRRRRTSSTSDCNCLGLPKSQSFDSDSLEKNVLMPYHPGDSRRARRQKLPVARKKRSSSASSLKSSSRSSHDSIGRNLASDEPIQNGRRERAPSQSSMKDRSRLMLGAAKRQQLM